MQGDVDGQVGFPPFRLDSTDERLWRGAESVPMTPRALAVLRYLVQHRGRLVTKHELLDAVWAGVHVGDAVVKTCIREIRRAIDDPASAPKFIQTVHRRGYRFIAEAAQIEAAGRLAPGQPSATPGRRPLLVGREQELAALRACLQRALDGERQVVFITGAPGIGKTTLVESFLDQSATPAAVRVAWGQCVEQTGSGRCTRPCSTLWAGWAGRPARRTSYRCSAGSRRRGWPRCPRSSLPRTDPPCIRKFSGRRPSECSARWARPWTRSRRTRR